MSNSYVLGIAVGIAFGIMLVAFIFSYLKRRERIYTNTTRGRSWPSSRAGRRLLSLPYASI